MQMIFTGISLEGIFSPTCDQWGDIYACIFYYIIVWIMNKDTELTWLKIFTCMYMYEILY